MNVRRTADENKRPYRAFRTKRLEVQETRREPRHIREGRSKGKRRKAQRNRRRVSKSNHQAARAEISPPPLGVKYITQFQGGIQNEKRISHHYDAGKRVHRGIYPRFQYQYAGKRHSGRDRDGAGCNRAYGN